MQFDTVTVHRTAQQRTEVLQSSDRQHQGFPDEGDEVATELFPVFADVPRERVRPGRRLFPGFVATGQKQLRVRGHFLQERGSGQVREGRDVWLDRSVGYTIIINNNDNKKCISIT